MRENNIFSINKKKIVVAGSNSGIGFALAKNMKRMGAKVIRVDKNFNNNLYTDDYVCDVQNRKLTIKIFQKIKKKYNQIDGFVNCIGISISNKSSFKDVEVFDKTIDVNLRGAFILLSECCKILKKNTGSVVNITSLGAEQGFPFNPSYQSSKAGLRQLTKSFARDYSYLGIRFNNVCPGYIKTKMTMSSYVNRRKNKTRSDQIMLSRWGEVKDIVGPVIFLLSNASSYITGSDIYVDGGWIAKGI